jgi:uncharacterized Zn finger protein (UPF0148 family)
MAIKTVTTCDYCKLVLPDGVRPFDMVDGKVACAKCQEIVTDVGKETWKRLKKQFDEATANRVTFIRLAQEVDRAQWKVFYGTQGIALLESVADQKI